MVSIPHSCNINLKGKKTKSNSNLDLKTKSRKFCVSKSPPPQRRDQMLCAILCRENCQDNNKNNQYVLSYNEPNLCNNCISKDQGRNNRFSLNFSRHCVLGHVLLDIDQLNEVDSWKEVV